MGRRRRREKAASGEGDVAGSGEGGIGEYVRRRDGERLTGSELESGYRVSTARRKELRAAGSRILQRTSSAGRHSTDYASLSFLGPFGGHCRGETDGFGILYLIAEHRQAMC